MMLFAILVVFPLQIFAAAPSAELTKKCEAVWADLMPLVLTPVFASLEAQEPTIVKALSAHGLICHDQVVILIREGLSKAWWDFRGYKRLDKPWVQPQRLKPHSPAHSELMRNLLLKYGSHHEKE